MDRRVYWKQAFEDAFRRGDRQAMVQAEEMLEAWTLAVSAGITPVDQEESEAQGGPVQQ